MDADKPKGPWWRKKRFAAYATVLLAVWYPASHGPAMYCHARGWLPFEAVYYFYEPLSQVTSRSLTLHILFNDYNAWWWHLGDRHRKAASD